MEIHAESSIALLSLQPTSVWHAFVTRVCTQM